MSKVLHCSIKEQFLNAIIRGAKRTEYRDMSEYWIKRLVDTSKYNTTDIEKLCIAICSDPSPKWLHYDQIRFHCANRTASYQIKKIVCYKHYRCFAIHLGEKV